MVQFAHKITTWVIMKHIIKLIHHHHQQMLFHARRLSAVSTGHLYNSLLGPRPLALGPGTGGGLPRAIHVSISTCYHYCLQVT